MLFYILVIFHRQSGGLETFGLVMTLLKSLFISAQGGIVLAEVDRAEDNREEFNIGVNKAN